MMATPGEGQSQFSDKELWSEKEKKVEQELPKPPEEPSYTEVIGKSVEKTQDEIDHFYRVATSMEIPDPFESGDEKTINLGSLLGRELKNSWHALYSNPGGRDKIVALSQTIMSRLGTPEAISELSLAYKNPPETRRLEQEIMDVDESLERLDNRTDPSADIEKKRLIAQREAQKEELSLMKRTNREIEVYLEAVATDWAKRLKKHGF